MQLGCQLCQLLQLERTRPRLWERLGGPGTTGSNPGAREETVCCWAASRCQCWASSEPS